VSISQVIGCKDHLRTDLDSVGLGIKIYSQERFRFVPFEYMNTV